MAFRYPQPDNEDGFEQLCVRLYRKLWKNESLKLYAKRGEEQNGIDIFDPLCIRPVRAVQCKHHESTKRLPPSKIKTEVRKAEKSHFDIEHYVIATTAKKSRNAQDTVAELNRRSDRKFTVDIHFWEDICQHASEFGRMMAELIIYGENVLAGAAATTQRSTASIMVNSSGPGSGDEDEPYAIIETLLNERRLELARHELDKLPAPDAADLLTPAEQYKLLRLRAKLELESGAFEGAATLFLQAYAVSPELDQAKQNKVLALSLLGNAEDAYAEAKQYLAEGLTTPVMVLRLIDCLSTKEQLEEHAALINAHIDTDENINTALSHKYMGFANYDRAYETAERALIIAPDSPHAHFVAALASHNASVHGERQQRRNRLQLALDHYDAAESAAREQRFSNLLPELLVNRAAAKMLLGDIHGAAADYRAAVESATEPSIYVERAISFFLQEQDFGSARELLDFLDHTTREAQYLALVAKYHSSDASDKRTYMDEMKALAEQKWDRAVACRFHCVQWALELKESELAESYIPSPFRQEYPFQAHTMLAWIRLESKDRESAKEEAAKALDESIHSAHPQELRILAQVLVNLKDDANAVGLLEQIAKPGLFDEDMKALIICAQRLDRHDLLLRICRELRTSGVRDDQLHKLEVQLLSQYAPREAFHLAVEFIQISATPSYFVAYKNVIAVRLNELDNLTLDVSSLPTPEQLSPGEAPLLLVPYVTAGMYDEALQFLYVQRRLYFEDEDAHGHYLSFFLSHGHKTQLREPSAVVTSDCAVLLELNRGGRRWVILEEEQPVASRGELSAGSELGHSLLDLTVGDVVKLPGNLVQVETATIREIQTKYVRAFQDTLENFRRLFPETSVLQQIHVGDDEHFDPSAIIESLKGRREHVEKCVELYSSHPCSLYLFATRVGITELRAIQALAQHRKGLVKCCQITPRQFEQAVIQGVSAEAIVLSISAIITMTLIDGWKFVDSTKRYLVSQMTSELIDTWLQSASEDRSQEGGVVILDDADELVIRETTDEERVACLEELRAIRQMVDTHCEPYSSLAVAELAPEKRNLYTELIGIHNVESICVAKEHEALLWSDDWVVGLVAHTDFDIAYVWTQLVLRCFVCGSISLEEFNRASAKLAAWDYVSIIWNPETIIAAGIEAEWNTEMWPLSRCLALIQKARLQKDAKVRTVVSVLRLLRRSDCIEMKQSAVIQAILNALGDAGAVRWILRHVYEVFGVDIPSAEFVRLELEYWLRLR